MQVTTGYLPWLPVHASMQCREIDVADTSNILSSESKEGRQAHGNGIVFEQLVTLISMLAIPEL